MEDSVVVEFTGGNVSSETFLDIPTEKVLSAAIEASLDTVVVIGVKEDGSSYLAFSSSDLIETLWLLENAKMDVLEMARDA